MADTTTELEVLDEIVDVLGGQSGQYETVVPTLQQIRDLLGGGGGGGGYNPSLSVGRADALTGADETAQWATCESAGSGTASVRSVQGAAVAWNQLCESIDASGFVRFGSDTATVQNHKYLFIADIVKKEAASNASVDIYGKPVGGSTVQLGRIVVQANGRGSSIFTMSVDGLIGGAANVDGNYWGYISSTTQSSSNGMLFDLTQMFGSGNEPQSVAEFEAMYPEAYYPYSAPTLKPVQIAGIASTDAQGGELDAIEWTAQTLRAAGSVADELTAGELVTRVGVTTVTGANYWNAGSAAYNGDLATDRYVTINGAIPDGSAPHPINVRVTDFTTVSNPSVGIWEAPDSHVNECRMNGTQLHICFSNALVGITTDMTVSQRTEAIKAWLNAHPQEVWFELATPTTTPISPALPMTYRVEQGGTEAIIVPDGEISAAPVLTVAEGESAADVVMDALACIAAPDGPTATSNHAVGTYLTMQGKLYKVTSAIAVGETIKSGTNVSQTTVMAELIARTA